ncbi:hexosyltransferase [Elysia marginata]|uniref:Hexosyltransferase n=1 Tax=Elysia marginata TaxID=1093978 RepID=A0AAV4IX56_9GAST|nr:hexosyltransferase [Elysia marginata]
MFKSSFNDINLFDTLPVPNQMQQILYQNYKEDKGSFKNTLKNKEVQKAVSLHPVKDPLYQYRIYNYLQAGKVMAVHQRQVGLHRDLVAMTDLLQDARYLPGDDYGLGLQPSLTKFRPLSGREVIPWEFISRSIYSHKNSNPRRGIDDSLKSALDELVNQVLMKVNKNAHVRGRTIDFKEIQYGYRRLDPLHGPDYVLDLLLTYRKYRDRKVAMNVRRHAYLQQVFLPAEMREDDLHVPQGLEKIPQQPSGQSDERADSRSVVGPIKSWLNIFYGQDSNLRNSLADTTRPNEHIDIVMPLMGRFKIFQRFMDNFEKVVLKPKSPARLVLVLYKSREDAEAHQFTLDLVSYYRETYGQQCIEIVNTDSEFSRGPALQLGAERCSPEALLFFLDVDIIFTPASLQRVRLNTRKGQQVYFPIVFSQYDPKPVCRPGKPSCQCQVGPGGQGSECVLVSDDVGEDSGYWRLFGFGIAALYRSDYNKVGGFDLSIRGWGKEDVDLYTKFIEYEYSIFRAVDPGMTHIFHAIQCSSNLEEAQMVMCVNSKAMSYASTRLLANSIYSNPEIHRRLEMHYLNRGS